MNLKKTILDLFAKPDAQPEHRPVPTDRGLLWQRFDEAARKTYFYNDLKSEYDQLIAHLRDGSVPAPVFKYGFYDDDLFGTFWSLLRPDPDAWDAVDERLLAFAFSPTTPQKLAQGFYKTWLVGRGNDSLTTGMVETIVRQLARHGVSAEEFWFSMLNNIKLFKRPDAPLTRWILARVEQYHATTLPRLQERLAAYLSLLLSRKPDFVRANLDDFLKPTGNHQYRVGVNPDVVTELLAHDPAAFREPVLAVLQQVTAPDSYRRVQQLLAQHFPDDIGKDRVKLAYDYLEMVRKEMTRPLAKTHYLTREKVDDKRWVLTVEVMFETLIQEQGASAVKDYIFGWMAECPAPEPELYVVIDRHFGPDSLPLLVQGLQPDRKALFLNTDALMRVLFKLIGQYDYSAWYPQIWALTRHKSKQTRGLAAVTLAKLGDSAMPEAEKLLTDKKADVRQTGALILSLIRTDRARTLLLSALDAEKNDDTRDLMLDSLTGLLPVPATESAIAGMVDRALQRGKLDAPVAPWLRETDLPALYWPSGNALDTDTVRFLLYRQNRAKDIRPDAEARPIFALVDRQRSAPFAGAVLKAFVEQGGADPKLKGCLTVGAMLGGDDEIDLLKTKVNGWADAGRGKMAEYAVQALALIGTNRALRAVEFFGRKYKNKFKNIGAAAGEAFGIAADTLGISPYDLADSIIPDFGFTGLFRSFVAGGETYRAFVGTDFKLAFLDEDNKLIRTVPKTAPTALKDEFKDIGKEIRDIVKAQSGRLEQYLVVQRKWPADKWHQFFLGNPVMFAYAVRLIWGVFGADQTLRFAFQCHEDQTLTNEAGDELDWSADLPPDALIGMVHPLSLTPEQISHWTGQLADAGVDPIFPQLTRQVIVLPGADRGLTMDRQFVGISYGGYGFVSKMEKLGWYRGSVQDNGWIASYYKPFADVGLEAVLMQQGNICVGYYDDDAVLGRLMFVRTGSILFGSYVYDEPENDTDNRLIHFSEVPPIVYSEVMADLLFFKENAVISE